MGASLPLLAGLFAAFQGCPGKKLLPFPNLLSSAYPSSRCEASWHHDPWRQVGEPRDKATRSVGVFALPFDF
jgi:hypothetical protein